MSYIKRLVEELEEDPDYDHEYYQQKRETEERALRYEREEQQAREIENIENTQE
jgi:hypothetical protein